MNTHQAHPTTLAGLPLYDRVAAAIDRTLAAVRAGIRSAARRRQAQSEKRRTLGGITHLNEHVLKDIGAPHSLVANAAERREVRHLQGTGAGLL